MGICPGYVFPASAFTRPVEVISAPQLVMEADKPKENKNFPGCVGYRLTVEATLGFKKKAIFNGKERKIFDAPELRSQSVTVWTAKQPEVTPGDYVRLENLMVGSAEKSTYCWCTGVQKIEVPES